MKGFLTWMHDNGHGEDILHISDSTMIGFLTEYAMDAGVFKRPEFADETDQILEKLIYLMMKEWSLDNGQKQPNS